MTFDAPYCAGADPVDSSPKGWFTASLHLPFWRHARILGSIKLCTEDRRAAARSPERSGFCGVAGPPYTVTPQARFVWSLPRGLSRDAAGPVTPRPTGEQPRRKGQGHDV